MKIAVTGHTEGIGASLKKIFEAHGHTVKGFSRSNGYDIGNRMDRAEIVDESKDCDVFINNAYSVTEPFAQCEMLFDIWESWQGQHRSIVNISSSITERWQHTFREVRYRTAKRALEDACDFLWNKSDWPHLMRVNPCRTDTPRTAAFSDPNKADPNKFAELVFHALSQDNFRVQTLNLAVNPIA